MNIITDVNLFHNSFKTYLEIHHTQLNNLSVSLSFDEYVLQLISLLIHLFIFCHVMEQCNVQGILSKANFYQVR